MILGKKYVFSFLVLLILGILIMLLIFDYSTTSDENKLIKQREEDYNLNISEDFKKYVPDSGRLIYLQFLENKNNSNNNVLTKSNDFRKAIYYAINRKQLSTNEKKEILKPAPVLFTKEFFQDKNLFNEPFFPQSQESEELYQEIKLAELGYNSDKALKLLTDSWENLKSYDGKKEFSIKIFFDMDLDYMNISDENIKPSDVDKFKSDFKDNIQLHIKEQIQKLFETFIQYNKLDSEALKLEEADNIKDADIKLENIWSKNDPYLLPHVFNKSNESLEIIKIFAISPSTKRNIDIQIQDKNPNDQQIIFNFIEIKNYLDKQKNSKKEIAEGVFIGEKKENIEIRDTTEIDNKLFINLINKTKNNENNQLNEQEMINNIYLGIDSHNGEYKGTIDQFFKFFDEIIVPLFIYNSPKISDELKKVKQKTYEEIFEKILNCVAKKYLYIPIAVLIEK
ncbi:MAG: hypothetical protein ACLTFB_01325 [Candidatus Phytoplasma pyri]